MKTLSESYKVRVNPEQSRKIQELLFALGGCWLSGSYFKEPVMLDADCLFLNKLMVLTCAYERGNCYFENKHTHTEIQAGELIALLTDLSKSAENPPQKMELTPKFKVGDKVYYRAYADICVVSDVSDIGEVQIKGWREDYYNSRYFCHATPENYEMLCKLYPHIQFESPHKEITGSDLTKGMFERGDFAVACKCSNISEYSAIASSSLRLITEYSKGCFLDNTGHSWEYAVPCDPKTGEPLTQAVLDE